MQKTINVDVGDSVYVVQIGHDLEPSLAKFVSAVTTNKKVLIVADSCFSGSRTLKIKSYLEEERFECMVYEMGGGKGSKSFSELLAIYAILESNNFSRDSTLIALGGGVVGDLGGFAASTWYRGMNLVHMPTTLMAMVDSSIGGKVAINFRETINAVGNYYHPVVNLMDLGAINTLSQRDFISGMAEVIKCALIADEKFLTWLEQNVEKIISRDRESLIFCIEKAIQIKVDHVRNDVREDGARLLLNFGHTLGHAIEMATQSDQGEMFRHGEGVSLGMVAAMRAADRFFCRNDFMTSRVINALEKFGLPVFISASELELKRDVLIDLCFNLSFKDKKRKSNSLRFIFLEQIGVASVYSHVPEDIVRWSLSSIIRE